MTIYHPSRNTIPHSHRPLDCSFVVRVSPCRAPLVGRSLLGRLFLPVLSPSDLTLTHPSLPAWAGLLPCRDSVSPLANTRLLRAALESSPCCKAPVTYREKSRLRGSCANGFFFSQQMAPFTRGFLMNKLCPQKGLAEDMQMRAQGMQTSSATPPPNAV